MKNKEKIKKSNKHNENIDNIQHQTRKNSLPFRKVILFPIALLKILIKAIKEKIAFSIGLTLSFRYFKTLLGAMFTAGLGIILVFGGLTIKERVSEDYLGIADFISKGQITYSEIETYAAEHNLPIQIYDQNKNRILATQPDLEQYNTNHPIGYVWTDTNFYLVIHRDAVVSGDAVKIVIYSDIKQQIVEVIYISKIILYVFSIVLFFSVLSIIFSGRGIFQPIKEMTQTVKEISEKNLNLRLNVGGSKNELKELALTFNEMMNRIEDHDDRQKQFVSDASHELRTPIAVIQGYAVMLDRWGKNDKEILQESIDAIKNEVESMNELIDKLLFLARHDMTTFMLQKEEFSLTEMLVEIVKETQIIDTTHKIYGDINQEVSLFADKNRIKQAIRVFIDNAIKYTPVDGEITIRLENNQDDNIAITIKDTGIGMNQEELEHIFNRFYRSDQSRTKENGGHGLGLAIAKIIVQGHNGKIKVRSKVGRGSEFIIFLKGESR